eukprot:m.226372 g.226372  ORF g.226372 m.226372 type:complete len:527 (+) comp40025_c0_seq2:98-1678(+)
MVERLPLKIGTVALAAIIIGIASLPTVVYVRDKSSFGFSTLGNSTCDIVIPINVTQLITLVGLDSNPLIVAAILKAAGKTIDLSPTEVRNVMNVLGVTNWPPPSNTSISATQIADLYQFVTSGTLTRSGNLTCHEDLVADEDADCCYIPCSKWEWLTGSRLAVVNASFAIVLFLGVATLVTATVAILKLKTERKFPHVMIVWYSIVCTVSPTIAVAVGWLIGREDAVCCGKRDALDVVTGTSPGCSYTIFFCVFSQFMYLSASFWTVCGLCDLWLAVGLGKGDAFVHDTNKVHLIQSLAVWGSSGVLCILPYAVKGGEAYSNIFLSYTCSTVDTTLQYFTNAIPIEVGLSIAGLCLSHLIYTLKKRSLQRKKLMAEGAGTTMNQTGLRQLQGIERQFLILMAFLFAVSLSLVIDYVVLGFSKQMLDLRQIAQDYLSCVLLHPEKDCPRGLEIGELYFTHLIVHRVTLALSFVGQFLFFSASKDVRVMWKRILTSCCKKRERLTMKKTVQKQHSQQVKLTELSESSK